MKVLLLLTKTKNIKNHFGYWNKAKIKKIKKILDETLKCKLGSQLFFIINNNSFAVVN